VSRIATTFAHLRAQHRVALMPYLTLGYPTLDSALELVPAMAEAGADLFELGIPFSDPLADGATNQAAAQRALENGMTVERCLATVRRLRDRGLSQPVALMGYYNPIFQRGPAAFCAATTEAGADGLIVVDLPPEESDELAAACQAYDLDLIFLLAPTSTEARVSTIARRATGFIYLVSLTGVTGARDRLPEDLEAFVARVRHATDRPLVVGFGISNVEQARRVARIADGVIVGSAIVKLAGESERPAEAVARFVAGLRAGIDGRAGFGP
jgi:tryptophan synthase alpha chain